MATSETSKTVQRHDSHQSPADRTWRPVGCALLFCAIWIGGGRVSAAADATPPSCAEQAGTTIELKLAKTWRPQTANIKRELQSGPGSITARVEVTPMPAPPMNIGVGRCVDADTARRAIRAAIDYNGGIDYLIFQDILPHRWIMIGTTQVAELSWTPVSREDLDQLSAPGLSTDEFQTLYRKLATPKERKRPFGLDAPPAP
jgi:hypothetical protein